jgi:hypothetical protein
MFSTWLGVVLLFAFFGLLALVVFRASPRGDTYEEKRAKARAEKLDAAQKQMLTALTTYGWVDKNKGVVRIPITEAMKLTVAELADKKPAAANPIATPEPSPAAATSPAASPAAATAATASPAASPSAAPVATATPTSSPKPSSVTGPDSEIRAQPAAAANPPNAPPSTQLGPSTTPASSPPPAAAKAQASPSASPSPSAPGTPLPVRGKTP